MHHMTVVSFLRFCIGKLARIVGQMVHPTPEQNLCLYAYGDNFLKMAVERFCKLLLQGEVNLILFIMQYNTYIIYMPSIPVPNVTSSKIVYLPFNIEIVNVVATVT